MQILLSCAKTMADHTAIRTPRTSEPLFRAEADAAAAALASLPADELARILRVNRTIAAENRRRYAHNFTTATPCRPLRPIRELSSSGSIRHPLPRMTSSTPRNI